MSERHACFWVFHHTLALRDIAKSSRLITDPKTDRGLIARLRFLWLLLQLQLQQELFSVPPQGAEQSRDSVGKSTVGDGDDAHSDAREVLCRIDDVRLIALVERWSLLSERVKAEILELAGDDQNDQTKIAMRSGVSGESQTEPA